MKQGFQGQSSYNVQLIEFFLNDFLQFAEFSDKLFVIIVKGLETVILCV